MRAALNHKEQHICNSPMQPHLLTIQTSSGMQADLGEDEPRALWSAPTAGMVVKEKDGGGAS
jgi:hypothetical protein